MTGRVLVKGNCVDSGPSLVAETKNQQQLITNNSMVLDQNTIRIFLSL